MTRLKLPAVSDINAYHQTFHDEVWEKAAAIICSRHSIPYTRLRRSPQGENIIFFIDAALVVKIFAPFRENYLRETSALQFARGKLCIETPELICTGEIEGWPYLVMTQLAGRASREVWESIGLRDRLEIMTRLGGAMRGWTEAEAPLDQPALNRDWHGFLERQGRLSVERQRACGADPGRVGNPPADIAPRPGLFHGKPEH